MAPFDKGKRRHVEKGEMSEAINKKLGQQGDYRKLGKDLKDKKIRGYLSF
ncbi:MAG: hypothetical protein KGM16_16850 [Bacteroidota bacterium]|nr:hypothetical protein [Bacteroidota bacterium]